MAEQMSDVVTYEVTEDGVAIIRADNPPVNALGYQNRLGLWNAIEKFDADATAKIATLPDAVGPSAERPDAISHRPTTCQSATSTP